MSVQIQLDGDSTSFEPGADIRGRVDWQPDGPARMSMMISLIWFTQGKGIEDVTVVDQIQIDHPRPHGHRDFKFRLPDFPWSFSGSLISLTWAVEASLEPKGTVERVTVISAPGGEKVKL